jgi:Pro-kumamolisin, activation domain/Bacterial Ig-like domain (group 3)
MQAVDEASRTTLRGNTHPLALARFDRGAAPASMPLDRMLLVLKRSAEQDTALLRLLDEQQDKSSPNYHKWLTPEEFGKRFGPADADIQTVTSWLETHGFRVNQVSKGRSVIEFSGTAAMVSEAFRTQIHKYVVGTESHWANASDPQIPEALTPVVAGIHTLHNFLKKPQLKVLDRVPAKLDAGPPPEVTFSGALHALGPGDYTKIYNIQTGQSDGFGTSIAVVARSNINVEDVGSFRGAFNLPNNNPQIFLNGPDPGDLGGNEEVEAVLDATWSGVLAPEAMVRMIVSASTNTTDGIDLSELYIIDNNAGDIMSESFGTCEAAVTSAEATNISQLAEQAAAQGITYLVAGGDTGAAGCDNLSETVAAGSASVNVLASTPFTVAVGGTLFNEHGSDATYWSPTNNQFTKASALSYIPENVWNESCTVAKCGQKSANIAAGGGGVSMYFAKPSWQAGVSGIPNDGMRDLPDISLAAAGHDPYLLCVASSCMPDAQGNFFFVGVSGTSASTPSFAGIVALVKQKIIPLNTQQRLGQINYVLYPLAGSQTMSSCNGSSIAALPASSCTFNDVTVGNNSVPGASDYGTAAAKYQSGAGYDLASGLGSVNVTNLINNWNTVAFNATTTTLSLNPITAVHGAAVTVTASVTSGIGTPTGDISLHSNTILSSPIQGNFFTLNAGLVSATTNLLPGGHYSVQAHYSGDTRFAASESNNITLTITPEPSATVQKALTLDTNSRLVSFTSAPYGSFVYLRSDINSTSGFGIPTGSVVITDTAGAIPGNPYQLNSQGNTATPNGLLTLAVGQHSITSAYGGDGSFAASTSSPVNFAIMQAPTTASVSAAPSTQGAILTATINSNSAGNPPSGTVTFFVGGNAASSPIPVTGAPATINPLSGTVATGAQATAFLTDSQLANGSYTISATYSGDSNYSSSTTSEVQINVQPDFGMFNSASSITIPAPGGSGTASIAVAAFDGFNGTVIFACSGLPSEASCGFNPSSVQGSGTTTVTVTTKGAHAVARIAPVHGPWPGLSVVGIAGLFLLGAPSRRRYWKRILILLAFTLVLAGVGCGGKGGGNSVTTDPGTPVGNYTVTVTGTSGSVSHTMTLNLTVQ